MGITIANDCNNIPVVYEGNSNSSVFQAGSDGAVRFDRELAKANYSGQPSFGTVLTRKELLQSIDEQLQKNKKLYGKTEVDWIIEQCPNWHTAKFKFAGENKIYTFGEFIREFDKRAKENA